MSPRVYIVAVVAVFIVLRLWFRLRHRRAGGDRHGCDARTERGVWRGPLDLVRSATGLVALREIRQRVRGRVFRVGTLLILAGVAAAIVIPVLTRGTHRQAVGVVGGLSAPAEATVVSAARSVGTSVRFVEQASVASASSDLRAGRVNLAIVDGREILVNKAIAASDASTTAELVRATARTLGVAQAVATAGLTPVQAQTLARARPLPVSSLQAGVAKGPARSTSVIGLILTFLMLTQYNTWTLIGVMEEKASRVVEVLLAAVRPVQLLGGKVLGIGVVVFAQATLIVAFALILAKAMGSSLLHGTAPLLVLSTLLWLVLGYAFYCWLYAAAGSMAERQDQVQALVLPLTLPMILGYIMGLTTASSGSPSTFFHVLAYLPPTAPFAMPVLVGLKAVSWWQFVASALLTVICTVGVARLAAGIYRRAVLRTGRRVALREIIAFSSASR